MSNLVEEGHTNLTLPHVWRDRGPDRVATKSDSSVTETSRRRGTGLLERVGGRHRVSDKEIPYKKD